MRCKICDNNQGINVIYHGPIRNGTVGVFTEEPQDVYFCDLCGCYWHKDLHENDASFYESEEYRIEIESSAEIENYYKIYDSKQCTTLGMVDIGLFRGKDIADIGCAGGSFLDLMKGLAKSTIAIEPSKTYQEALRNKGHKVYSYIDNAFEEYKNKLDIVTSFDVIEHLNDPVEFISQQFNLLKNGGQIVVGTPTDYPNIRQMIPEEFEPFLFSVQHPWIFSEKALKIIATKAGFKLDNIQVQHKQRFGLSNLLNWLKYRSPKGDLSLPFISSTLEDAYRREQESSGKGDYLVLTAIK